ncbi:hypothetical protein RBB80_32490 (plasmid) [Tunturiibacter gelidiferens]
MELQRVTMRETVPRSQQVGYVYSQCDFNSFDRIQEKKAKLPIKNIQMGNLLKGRPGAKVILNDDLLFAGDRMKNRFAGQRMPKNVAFTKGIPVARSGGSSPFSLDKWWQQGCRQWSSRDSGAGQSAQRLIYMACRKD